MSSGFDFNKLIEDLVACRSDNAVTSVCVTHAGSVDAACAKRLGLYASGSGLHHAGLFTFGTQVIEGEVPNETIVMIVRMGCMLRAVHYGYEQHCIERTIEKAWEVYKKTLQTKLACNAERTRKCLSELCFANKSNLPVIKTTR